MIGRKTQAVSKKRRRERTAPRQFARQAKSVSTIVLRVGNSLTVRKKKRSERKGRRNRNMKVRVRAGRCFFQAYKLNGRRLQEVLGLRLSSEQGFHCAAQSVVPATGGFEKGRAFALWAFQRGAVESLDLSPAFRLYRAFVLGVGCNSQTFAVFQSRWTLFGETFSSSGVSSAGVDLSPVTAFKVLQHPHIAVHCKSYHCQMATVRGGDGPCRMQAGKPLLPYHVGTPFQIHVEDLASRCAHEQALAVHCPSRKPKAVPTVDIDLRRLCPVQRQDLDAALAVVGLHERQARTVWG